MLVGAGGGGDGHDSGGDTPPCSFQCALSALVGKMAIEHPHHCVLQLLALRNGGKHEKSLSGKQAMPWLFLRC